MKRRTASYKRKRRAKNKERLEKLIAKPRDPNRPSRPFNVVFYQRRQMLFSFRGAGVLYDVDETGHPIIPKQEKEK